MPYELEKSGSKYYVVNKVTGKRHSGKPLSQSRAKRQMRALTLLRTTARKTSFL
jgi:hypothetical protein